MCGIIAPFSYFVAQIVAALFFPGYNHLTDLMSALGATGSPFASATIANIVGLGLTGLLVLFFAVGYFLGMRAPVISRFVPAALLAISGICFMIDSVIHCDPGCINTSPSGLAHIQVGNVLGLAFTLSPLAAVYAFTQDKRWNHTYWMFSVAMTIAGFLFFLLGPIVFGTFVGLQQRIESLPAFLWLVVIGTKLFRIADVILLNQDPGR